MTGEERATRMGDELAEVRRIIARANDALSDLGKAYAAAVIDKVKAEQAVDYTPTPTDYTPTDGISPMSDQEVEVYRVGQDFLNMLGGEGVTPDQARAVVDFLNKHRLRL